MYIYTIHAYIYIYSIHVHIYIYVYLYMHTAWGITTPQAATTHTPIIMHTLHYAYTHMQLHKHIHTHCIITYTHIALNHRTISTNWHQQSINQGV